MKYRRIIFVLCALLAMGAMTMGCEPESYNQKTEEKEPTGGGSTTGDGGKEDDGGGKTDEGDKTCDDGSDIDVSAFDSYSSTFTSCGYEYADTFGDTDGYILYLADDDYDWIEEEGEGTWAIVELFAKAGEGIAPGKYCINDTMESGTVYVCQIGVDDTVSGTMYGEGEYAYVCPNAGYVEISKNNDNYNINIRFIDEAYEGLFTGTFTGPLTEYDFSGDEGGDDEGDEELPDGPEGDYEMTGICEAYAYNLGAAFGGSGYDDWMIYMYNESDEEYMCLELLTSTGNDLKVPAGTYDVKFISSEEDLKPGACVAIAFDDEDEYAYGTYYGYGDYIWYGADSGKVTVSGSGDNVTIKMELVDEYEGVNFGATYTGAVDCYDGTEESFKKANVAASKRHYTGHVSHFQHNICRKLKK